VGIAADAAVEIEAKLSVSRPGVVLRRLARSSPDQLAGFERSGPGLTVVVVDRYLDTADGALERVEARARLRASRSGVVLTVKRRGVVDGALTTRQELEGPATPALEPASWPPSAARDDLIALAGGREIVETVRLRQRRTIRRLRRSTTVAEVSLDRLEALDGPAVLATRWELEAELKAGDPAALQELADVLRQIPGVGDALGSKRWFVQEALAAASGARIAPPTAQPSGPPAGGGPGR
jgi:inorganic triphosphatase YgiF